LDHSSEIFQKGAHPKQINAGGNTITASDNPTGTESRGRVTEIGLYGAERDLEHRNDLSNNALVIENAPNARHLFGSGD
jgi:hypothetical protein